TSAAPCGWVSRPRSSIVNHGTELATATKGWAPSWPDWWKPIASVWSDGWWSTTGPTVANGTQACGTTAWGRGVGVGGGGASEVVVSATSAAVVEVGAAVVGAVSVSGTSLVVGTRARSSGRPPSAEAVGSIDAHAAAATDAARASALTRPARRPQITTPG